MEFLVNGKLGNFQVCNWETASLFLGNFFHRDKTHLWTILKTNVEPLLLETFPKSDNWPVPQLFGYCGRTVIEENCGIPLNDIEHFDWYHRAYVALQLLEISEAFTFDHAQFRLYLTDISPDNIAVNATSLKVCLVDLENAVLRHKEEGADTFHYSQHTSNEEYAFSSSEICDNAVSDHNVYSVCMLLLSTSAPYPMMNGGLLHSPPPEVEVGPQALFDQIELCVNSMDHIPRFMISKTIKGLIHTELHKVDFYNTHINTKS